MGEDAVKLDHKKGEPPMEVPLLISRLDADTQEGASLRWNSAGHLIHLEGEHLPGYYLAVPNPLSRAGSETVSTF